MITDERQGLQHQLEVILHELDNPVNWTQEQANSFYEGFCRSRKGLGDRLILKITRIIPIKGGKLLIGVVLNPDTFLPFTLPFNNEKWNVSFALNGEAEQVKEGEIVVTVPMALDIEALQGRNDRERRMRSMVSVKRNSVKQAPSQTQLLEIFGHRLERKLGHRIVEKLSEQLGSLEELSNFVLEEFIQIYEDHIQCQNEELDRQEQELEKKKQHLDQRQSQLEEKESSLNERERQLNEKEQQLDEYESRLHSQFERLRLLPPRSLSERLAEEEESGSELIPWNGQGDIIDVIRGALHTQCDLQYERDVIECFVGALKTNQLIILHGPSGTGKSSLVRGFANIIKGAKSYTIRVQPSWTDKQDIVGFLNPIDYQYISTEFLDALVEARANPTSLYLICLDEMNLSHVEYYFAEFLSAREENPPKITLYSKHFEEMARRMIEPYIVIDENGIESFDEEKWASRPSESEKWKLQNCFQLCHRYPAELDIPDNVRFIGTMNIDHTVKGLSPKIIDRSFFIELRHPQNEDQLMEELEKIGVNQKIFLDIQNDLTVAEMDEEYRQRVKQLNTLLTPLGARLNHRALKHIGYYGRAIPSGMAFDQIVRGKILPRIHVQRDGNTVRAFEQLVEELNSLSPSARTKEKIEEMRNNGRLITYWR
ncbi:AAA family ATPase [Geobacillus sp. 46C-IIa]|uniref:McrB family protein n=1 Tax=Geobacillus sp. 46C-IIa TaxID=1963025 RepID=UPI001301A1C1|nr:AAA family ATPase [Geobacillus sp. 46C-IIa]QNU28080.1 AAA family ATPase [Geobacillus sp. 46C-IIa]